MLAIAGQLPTEPTRVTFPAGEVYGHGRLLAVVRFEGKLGLIFDKTPFHPVDYSWPDQPADHGTIRFGSEVWNVSECKVGAIHLAGRREELIIGSAIHASRAESGWNFVVVHIVDEREVSDDYLIGDWALSVGVRRRNLLSACHTACHLTAFALNRATHQYWSKEVIRDSLGSFDFDSLSLSSSSMDIEAARDSHRLGRSLRKKGFRVSDFVACVEEVREEAELTLKHWLEHAAHASVQVSGPYISSDRVWSAELPPGNASIRCGGTHVANVQGLASIDLELYLTQDATDLTVFSKPRFAAPINSYPQ